MVIINQRSDNSRLALPRRDSNDSIPSELTRDRGSSDLAMECTIGSERHLPCSCNAKVLACALDYSLQKHREVIRGHAQLSIHMPVPKQQ